MMTRNDFVQTTRDTYAAFNRGRWFYVERIPKNEPNERWRGSTPHDSRMPVVFAPTAAAAIEGLRAHWSVRCEELDSDA